MQETVNPLLTQWESFYVIVGSSGAALTGLQFVVVTLGSESRDKATRTGLDAFATPTIVYFCTVLGIAAVLCAPWQSLVPVAWLIGLLGVGGLVYGGIVIGRARRQTSYDPVVEDWIFYTGLPIACYLALLVSAGLLLRDPRASLFAIGGTALLLLFTGIHNAWDTVTFLAFHYLPGKAREGGERGPQSPADE